ncbi:MAG TPA: tetratricopeptide repeat protein [Vicinamibacterales bacterium]|nr:tetratricopeptide repeat protein [Vicinamibacterales bacterium]
MSRLRRAVVILAIAAGSSACRTERVASVPPLPDLGAMAAPVQQQIRDEYARLTTSGAASTSDRDRAAALGRVGELLMAAESVPAAEPFLSQAAALDPNDPRWPYFLAHLSRMKGDAPGAASYFQRVLTLRPDDVPSLVWLGNLSLDQGQTEAAERSYTRALELHSNLFAALFGLGRTALVAGRYQDAVTKLEAAAAAEPRATAANYPLAMAYRQAGRLDEAEARLRARGDAQPPVPDPLMAELADILESPVVYEGRGDRALARGQMPAAVAAFRHALALAPGRPAVKQKLATALALTGDVPGAVALYQELLRADPDFAAAHYSLGALLVSSGQWAPAIEQFAAAVRADPDYIQARLQLGHALRRARAFDRALAAYQGALSVDPRFAEARLGYAVTLADAGRDGTARAWLTDGRRAHPERSEFVELLVRVLAAAPDPKVRDGGMAVTLGERLVRETRSWRTLEALAMALAETGRWPEAIARQREAIDAFQRAPGRATPALADNLHRYERREPCRVPWSFDPLS